MCLTSFALGAGAEKSRTKRSLGKVTSVAEMVVLLLDLIGLEIRFSLAMMALTDRRETTVEWLCSRYFLIRLAP